MSDLITCPTCEHKHEMPIRVTAETPHRASKRPATPEMIHLCPSCGALLVLSLQPAPQEAIAS
jgi:hypothetical protein